MKRSIVIGCDHGGYELKEIIKAHLLDLDIMVTDVGTDSAASVDYPVFAHALCKKIQNKECELGILVCGTGIGMSMVANKHKGIRAACAHDTFSAKMTRCHNDANVLCLGGRVVGAGVALQIVDEFLNAEFEGGRHQRRVDMINSYDEK